jgi:type VI secretion system Hcp family effector
MQIPGVVAQEIEVFGYDQQTTNTTAPPDGGGGGGGKFIAGPVTVSKRLDEVTPLLNLTHVRGEHIREVILKWYRVDPSGRTGDHFLTVKLGDVIISAIHRSLPNQQDPALVRLGEVEAISFNYGDLQISTPGPANQQE